MIRSSLNLEGKKFGKLFVKRELDPIIEYCPHKSKRRIYLCICECGKEKEILGRSLSFDLTKSCGCLLKEKLRERCKKDLVGVKVGKLKVLKEVERPSHLSKKDRSVYYLCECECGKKIIVRSGYLQGTRPRK